MSNIVTLRSKTQDVSLIVNYELEASYFNQGFNRNDFNVLVRKGVVKPVQPKNQSPVLVMGNKQIAHYVNHFTVI